MCGAAAALYEHLRAMHLEHEGMIQKMEVDEINDILMVRQALTDLQNLTSGSDNHFSYKQFCAVFMWANA